MIELKLELALCHFFWNPTNWFRFRFDAHISLYGLQFWLSAGNRVRGIIYADIRPRHSRCVTDVPVNFRNQTIAIACGGRGYTGYGGDIFWFPNRRQKEHFLFLTGHRGQSEEKEAYSVSETLDDIPF